MTVIAAGAKLGRYEVRSKIGEGGMGEVYLAEDTRLRRNVALKILPADLAANKDRMRRFEQEAQAAAALNHPNSPDRQVGVPVRINMKKARRADLFIPVLRTSSII